MDITENMIMDVLNMEEPVQAEPVVESTETIESAPQAGENAPAAENADESKMTADERRENAARRRRQEQQAAIDAAVKQALAEERERNKASRDELVKGMNLKNTVDGSDIESEEDYRKWEKQYKDAKLQRSLNSGKLTIEDIDAVVDRHPVVEAARKIQEREETAARERENARIKETIEKEIEEIGRFDPAVKSVEDFRDRPYFEKFSEYVGKGLTFLEAFKLANADNIQQAAASAAKNSALSNARGKGHLQPPGYARGAGAMSVPHEEMAMFNLLNPGASADEIQAYYNAYKK